MTVDPNSKDEEKRRQVKPGAAKSRRRMQKHGAVRALEIALAVVVVVLLVASGLLWRLTQGPLDAGFARGYIEEALYDPVTGHSVAVQGVTVQWPDLAGPLVLGFDQVTLTRQGRIALTVDNVTLGLSGPHLLAGRIEPVRIALTAPSLHLVRTADNAIRLSLDDPIHAGPAEPKGDESNPLMDIVRDLSRPEGTLDSRSPIDRLRSVEIRQARAIVEDYRLGITWHLSPLDLTFARTERGLAVTAAAVLPGPAGRPARLQADVTYERDKSDFVAALNVQNFDPRVLARKIDGLGWLAAQHLVVNGNIALEIGGDLSVGRAAVTLSAENGSLSLPDLYAAPLPVDALQADALYDRANGRIEVRDLTLRTDGTAFHLAGPVTLGMDGSLSAHVTVAIPTLPQARIPVLWPAPLRGDGAEIWLGQKLSEGTFSAIQAAFDLSVGQAGEERAIDVENIVADFAFTDMNIAYRPPLAPVTNASGLGHFENDTLQIDIEGAAVAGLSIPQARATLSQVVEGGGEAAIAVKLDGPLQNVFRYIGPEPIGVSEDRLGLRIDGVAGQAKLDVAVAFPTLRDLRADQVRVTVDGTLDDILLPDVVKTLDLTGGPFALKIADGAAELEGDGKLDGRPGRFSWREYLDSEDKPYTSRVTAALAADGPLRAALGVDLAEWIDGTFPVDIVYTEHKDRAEATVQADLTPGTLTVAPFAYEKPPGVAGTAACTVQFRGGAVRAVTGLAVETPDLHVRDANFSFTQVQGETQLRTANLPAFRLAENDLAMEIESGADRVLKMAVTGTFLDALPFLGDKKKEPRDGSPLILSAAGERMRTHPARMVNAVKIYLDMDRSGSVNRFEMDAAAGKGPIYLRLKPDKAGIMTLQLEADDAGAALRAFNMYENIQGGKLALSGKAASAADSKILRGRAELSDFNVVNAPILAQLLNVISLTGIQQLLGGEGIYFSRLESDFIWRIRPQGDLYAVRDGRTSGSALGLTFDGTIDKATGVIAMEGTIVPVSLVSEIVKGIPLIGDILTGGGGGIIAATYKIDGPVKTPDVSVNPLSVLAPGILRKILFEGD